MLLTTRTALFAGLVGYTCTISLGVTPSNIVEQVTTESYSNHLASLYTHIGESRGFTDNTNTVPRTPLPQHDLARDYMVSKFTEWGYDTWLDPFEFDVNFSYDNDSNTYHYAGCNNVIAVKRGHGGTNIYLLVAHYDSVDSGHRNVTLGPGADDGASGVAALLEVAQVIQDYTFKDTILIAAFDAEEKDYQGAIHFRDTHITDNPAETNDITFLKSSITAVVNLDSIAYDDTNNAPQVVIGTVSEWNPVVTAASSAMSKYTGLTPVFKTGYNSSDHRVFHAIGIDSIHVIEYDFYDYWGEGFAPNPYYHTDYDAIDSPNYLRLDYAAEVTKGIVGAICDNATPILPATLSLTVNSNTISVGWVCVPDVSYGLYGIQDLSSTNAWDFVQGFPATNISTNMDVEMDFNSFSHRNFRVISE